MVWQSAAMDISEARRLNLLEAVKAIGGEARFVEAHDVSQAQLWQWLNKRRNIGEKAARKLEAKIGQPTGWLDQPRGEVVTIDESATRLSPTAMRLIKQIERLDEEGRLTDDLAKMIGLTLKLAPPVEPPAAEKAKATLPPVVGGKTVAEARAALTQYEGEQRLKQNADFYHDEAKSQIKEIRTSGKKKKAPQTQEAENKH